MSSELEKEMVARIATLERQLASQEAQEHPPWGVGCRVYLAGNQNITNSEASISYDTEWYDTDGCWAVGDPTKLYARHAGYYLAGAHHYFPAGEVDASGGTGRIYIRANGSVFLAGQEAGLTDNTEWEISVVTGMFYLAAGEYIEVRMVTTSADTTIRTGYATASVTDQACAWLARIA